MGVWVCGTVGVGGGGVGGGDVVGVGCGGVVGNRCSRTSFVLSSLCQHPFLYNSPSVLSVQ